MLFYEKNRGRKMRIYKHNNKNSFLALDLGNKKVSTRSSYPETFFDNLISGNYSYFSFQKAGVVSANQKEIIFNNNNYDEYNGEQYFKASEIYRYIGNANDKENLINLLTQTGK